MKVCLIVEGAYPYVRGGVSSWVQNLMIRMPDVEFIIETIVASPKEKREFKYEIPPNVSEIRESYLLDDDYISGRKQKKRKLSKREYEAFESLLFGIDPDWETIIQFFAEKNVSLNSFLIGEDFFKMVQDYYMEHFERMIFSDFLWTMRSMYLPLFTILKSQTIESDLYHSVSNGYAGMWGSIQKSLYKKPFLMTEHGIYTREREEEIIKANWVRGVYKDLWIEQFKKIGRCCYHYADKVVSLFEDARQFQIELGCPIEKTIVIPNGVNAKRFEGIPQKEEEDRYINIGAVLRVTPIKDVKTLISAYMLAKQKEPNLKLWVMGNMEEAPEYAQECKNMVENLKIPDVVFTGTINVMEYIGKMDIMILSSISEGQPLSILESFAAKKPFIATHVGNCQGLIYGERDSYGSAGYVVPVMGVSQMAECILQMAKSPEKRKKMGEVAYQRVTEFYDDFDIYQKYHQLYENMIEGKEGI